MTRSTNTAPYPKPEITHPASRGKARIMVSNSKPASGSTRCLMDSSETFTAWA